MNQKNYNISLKEDVEIFTKKLFYALFDSDYCERHYQEIEQLFMAIVKKFDVNNPEVVWEVYSATFKEIRQDLDLDAEAFLESDPAAKSLEEVYLAYPGFHAIAVYRLTHQLYKLDIPILPRMMSEYAHGITGADIHPGAEIGASFFIDHATGIVIGETSNIGNRVKIFQGVTLGGIKVKKDLQNTKRHPTIEDHVTIYANATILGGNIIVGAHSTIGANVCILESVPKHSLVVYQTNNQTVSLQKS